jgi:hypothetical protein
MACTWAEGGNVARNVLISASSHDRPIAQSGEPRGGSLPPGSAG